MASTKTGFSVSGSGFQATTQKSKITQSFAGFQFSFSVPSIRESNSRACRVLSSCFTGQELKPLTAQNGSMNCSLKTPSHFSVTAQEPSKAVNRAMRWWEKTLKPNMIEIQSAQELVDFLVVAGDRLVIMEFFSPSCHGCKTLHPKMCQLAEQNPEAVFVKVNHDELKAMSHVLKVHVLPFFRFYRGSEGHLSSFSCTSATIKKFKDALTKHGTERCSLGPPKGLNQNELLELASIGEIKLSPESLFPNEAMDLSNVEELVVSQGMDLWGLSKEALTL